MKLTQILESAASMDDLLGGKVKTLVDLALALEKALPDLAAAIGGAQDPWSAYVAVRDGIGNQAIADAFAAIGADGLYTDLKDLADEVDGKLPAEVEVLLRRLGHYDEGAVATDPVRDHWATGDDPGLIAWDAGGKLLAGTVAAGTTTGSAGLSGKIAASCEAGSLWFYAGDGVPSKGLLQIGLAGELGVNAAGAVPFAPAAGLDVAAAAGVGAQVHLFWRRPQDQLVARAIADVISRPVNVFSLQDMLAACHAPDGPGLEGLIMAIDGHASLDIDLAVARDIDVEGLFSGTAGLTVSIGLARKAAYELSVRKVADGVRLVLSHADEDARKWGVGLGVEIDATPIVRRVGAVVARAVEHWDKALAEIKPFLSPGTWLQKQSGVQLGKLLDALADDIGDEAVIGALRNDLQLALGLADDGDNGLANLLARKVLDAVGSLEGMVTGKADALAKQAVGKLAMHLPAVARDQIRTRLETEIAGLIGDYQGKLEAVVDDLAGNRPQEVSQALGKLGTKVSAKAGDLDKRVAELRELVEKVDKLVHRIAAEVEDAANAKITARLRFERGRRENEEYEVAGTFTRATAAAQALYASLMMGRLGGAVAVFDPDAAPIPGFVPDIDKCSVRRFSQVSKTLGYEVVLLGMDLSGSAQTSGSADVTVSASGKISVKTVSIAKRDARGFNTSRKAEYIQTGAILLARAEAGGRPADLQTAFDIDLSSQRADKDLTGAEVRAFLARMVRCGLLADTRRAAAVDFLDKALGNRGGGKLPGAVTVEMRLNAVEVGRLVRHGAAIPEQAAQAFGPEARKVFDTALDALLETGEWDRDDYDWFVDRYIKGDNPWDRQAADPRREKHFANLDHLEPAPIVVGSRTVHHPDRNRYNDGKSRHDAVVALLALVGQTARMAGATPSGRFERDGTAWGLRDYRRASQTIAEAAGKWIGLNQFAIFFFGKGMDHRTVALMLALARLAVGRSTSAADYAQLFDIALVVDGAGAQAF